MHRNSIVIHRAILHIVDPNGPGNFVLSDRELQLDEALKSFLKDHIARSLADPAVRAAQFEGRKSVLKDHIDIWRKDPEVFLDVARAVAVHLHSIVREDKRISGAVIAICECENETGMSLGVLKLDPSRAFRPKVRGSGVETYVELEQLQNVVPITGERLQKAVFFPRTTDKLGCDMIVLDRQQANADDAAQFFTKKFLAATLFVDDRELTRRFHDIVVATYNASRPTLSQVEAQEFRNSLQTALEKDSIEIDPWIDELQLPGSTKEALQATLHEQMPIKTFTPDEQTAQKLTKVRIFRGEHGFLLKMNASSYADIVVGSPTLVFEETEGVVAQIRLRVANLREESR